MIRAVLFSSILYVKTTTSFWGVLISKRLPLEECKNIEHYPESHHISYLKMYCNT